MSFDTRPTLGIVDGDGTLSLDVCSSSRIHTPYPEEVGYLREELYPELQDSSLDVLRTKAPSLRKHTVSSFSGVLRQKDNSSCVTADYGRFEILVHNRHRGRETIWKTRDTRNIFSDAY